MEIRGIGKTIWFKDLSPGNVFAYRVGIEPAHGISLKKNQNGFAAVALTHAPGKQLRLPSLVSDQFFELGQPIFVYEEAYALADQKLANFETERPKTGSLVLSVAGTFLRCHRDGSDYEVDLTTGELKTPGQTPTFWTPRWAIKDRLGSSIFEHIDP
ncbi:hypothetical protein ACQR1W_01945 [Bradyrhizobium sp. HKCCYLS1011]|uniref:hypothetical protein n=1 Tax=Bradyrhizobium sp. HKCCYLS1011 TaxID=3420733 RepID=UPI003EB7C52C